MRPIAESREERFAYLGGERFFGQPPGDADRGAHLLEIRPAATAFEMFLEARFLGSRKVALRGRRSRARPARGGRESGLDAA